MPAGEVRRSAEQTLTCMTLVLARMSCASNMTPCATLSVAAALGSPRVKSLVPMSMITKDGCIAVSVTTVHSRKPRSTREAHAPHVYRPSGINPLCR